MQMGAGPYTFTDSTPGQLINPTDTVRGIARPAAELGRLYWSKGPGADELRLIRIVKNDSGASLARSKLVKYDTGSADYPKNIVAATAADGDPVAGGVEEAYSSGVPTAYWFRMVVWAHKFQGILANLNSSRIALNPGDRVVPYSNGQFLLQALFVLTDSPASQDALRDELVASYGPSVLAQIQNCCGKSLDVTTNVAGERGAYHYLELDCTK